MMLKIQVGLTDVVHMVVVMLCHFIRAMGKSNVVERRS